MGNYKNILIAVSGLTPQIVSETLYYLVCIKQIFIDEIYILTTLEGEKKINCTLLAKNTIFHLYQEYGLAMSSLPYPRVILIRDADGQPIADVRTSQDNITASRNIIDYIRRMTAMPDTALYCSIAGGRKTMSAYMALALNLFGRDQDQLSHVLVWPEEIERNPDFFYPSRNDETARIELAEIPFIRLRKRVFRLFGSMEDIEFEDLLRISNSRIEDWEKAISVRLNPDNRELSVTWGEHQYSVKLPHKGFVIYNFLFNEQQPQVIAGNTKLIGSFDRYYDSGRVINTSEESLRKDISELNKKYLEPALPAFIAPFLKITADKESRLNQYYIPLNFRNRITE
jgi:CRISPR-associated protein (TIGR02584 family)